MQVQKTLLSLGLSSQEAEMYMVMLRVGGGTASVIAREAGIKRTTAYAIIKNLKEKGFALVYFRSGTQVFHAQKPHRVATLLEQKLESFNAAIPLLESFDRTQTQKLGLRFIETAQELERFYDEILIEYRNKSYRIIGSVSPWENVDKEYFVRFREKRAEAKIKTQLLLTADSIEVNPKDTKLLREVRFLPKQYSFKSTIDIYDDKILIVSPSLASLAVVVAIPAMIDVFNSVFEMLWEYVDVLERISK